MRRREVSAMLLVALLAVAAYAPVAGHDFVLYDDPINIHFNPLVRDGVSGESVIRSLTTIHAEFWIPLTWVSLAADRSLFGDWAGGFHLTNVLLHAANAALLLVLLVRLTGLARAGLLAAILFALHPINVESVAWVSERKDVLSLCLGLAALLGWVGYLRRPSAGRYLGAALLFALSLMAKPMLMVLPVLLLVLDWWPLGRLGPPRPGRPSGARLLAEKAPLAAMAVAAGLVTWLARDLSQVMVSLRPPGSWNRLANAAHFAAGYLWKGLWPSRLGIYYLDEEFRVGPGALAASLLVLAAVTAAAVCWRRRRPHLAAGWAWYLAALLPVSGVLRVGDLMTADHFVYLPFIGLYLTAALALVRLADRTGRWGAPVLAAATVAVLFPLTRAQVATWRNGETLARHAVRVSPDSINAREVLALSHHVDGRTAEAEAESRRILARDPLSFDALRIMGEITLARGEWARGVDYLRRAARQTIRAPFLYAIGETLLKAGDPEGAAEALEGVVRAEPANAGALALYGTALAEAGRTKEAETALRRAGALDPAAAMPRFNLGVLLARQGKREEAAGLFREVLRLDPGNGKARDYLLQLGESPGN